MNNRLVRPVVRRFPLKWLGVALGFYAKGNLQNIAVLVGNFAISIVGAAIVGWFVAVPSPWRYLLAAGVGLGLFALVMPGIGAWLQSRRAAPANGTWQAFANAENVAETQSRTETTESLQDAIRAKHRMLFEEGPEVKGKPGATGYLHCACGWGANNPITHLWARQNYEAHIRSLGGNAETVTATATRVPVRHEHFEAHLDVALAEADGLQQALSEAWDRPDALRALLKKLAEWNDSTTVGLREYGERYATKFNGHELSFGDIVPTDPVSAESLLERKVELLDAYKQGWPNQ